MPKTRPRRNNTLTAVVAGLAMAILVILVHQKVMGYDQEGCSAPHWTRISQDGDRLTLRQRSGRCKLEVDLRGDLRWNEAEDEVAWIDPRGFLEVEHRTADTRHRLKVRGSNDGTPQVEYWRDGNTAAVDVAARVWLHDVAMVMFRRAGIDASARSQRIFEHSGASGLVDEMDAISSDHVAARYARAAFVAPAEELAEVLRAVARRVGSDHTSAELLVDLADAGLPPEPSPALVRALEDVLATLGSDYELRRSVVAFLALPAPGPELTNSLLEAAAHGLGSDYEAAKIVAVLGGSLAPRQPLPVGVFGLLRTIGGDYEMRRSLVALLDSGRTDDDLRELLAVAQMVGSDYDMAEVLVVVVRAGGVSSDVEPSFRAALQLIGSDYERKRAEAAWQEKKGAPS